MLNKSFNSSHRMQNVQPPIIPIVADLINKNPGTISLGQGVVYYGPPASALKRARQIDNSLAYHLYSAAEGIPELHEKITHKLKRDNNIELDGQQRVVVTAGSNMAFVNAIMAIADPGDEIILLSPYYFNHEMAITMLNCKPVVVSCNDNFQPCLSALASAITNKTRAIVTVSPNNPSGAVYPEETLREINTLCKNQRIYHISDEAYEYFTFDETEHFSPASIFDSSNYTISLYSLSKAYGFASWRIGYMLIPEHLYLPIKKVQDTNLICPARITQEAAIAALNEGPGYCLSQLDKINVIRNVLYTALQNINDICLAPKTSGAFYFLIKLKTGLTGMQLVELLINDYKVAVIPGETFGLNDACYLRVAYGALDMETSSTGIQRLINGLTDIIRK